MRSTLLSLGFFLSTLAVAQTVTITAEQWARPRSGQSIVKNFDLAPLLAAYERQPQGAIVIYHPGGDEGVLWAEELRSWFVALGLPSSRVLLQLTPELTGAVRLEARSYAVAR